MDNKGKILVVDDDRLVLATLTHGLSQAGYEVIDADNGDDAILLARQHRPELALLDIRMEGKSGFDVAAYLREYCQIPFMFLSAFTDEATVSQVKKLGALTYLVKPLDIQQIVPAVEAAFANRAKAPSLAQAPAPVADAPVLAPAPTVPAPVVAPIPLKAVPPVVAPVVTPPAPMPTQATFEEMAPVAVSVPAVSSNPLEATVALAVGIVMHRHSLTRQAALDKLRHQAQQENRSVEALCDRLLGAQEVLAGLGSI
ncbi:MAG: response regulator [Burkholderiales bacterium]|nr:response regulator [Burkholderiales bacterium]